MKMDSKIRNIFWIFISIGVVVIFLLYKVLVLSLLMNGIPIMREYYDIANLIANIIDIISIIILLLIFKMKVSKGSMKGCAKGICVYGLPITVFSVFYSVQAIYWIFNGHAGLYGHKMVEKLVVNLLLYLTVGIEEELIFRGVVLDCIFRKNKTIVLGCLYSGLLFGLAHLENLIWGEDMKLT